MGLTVIKHALANHHLKTLRDKSTRCEEFRRATDAITRLLVIEATRELYCEDVVVETPITTTTCQVADTRVLVVPILRAGLGMLDSTLRELPDAVVGYVGLERDHETARASSYYEKLPETADIRMAIVLDPMLATGGSADHALNIIGASGIKRIVLLNVVCAPEGVAKIVKNQPIVEIFTAALDARLDKNSYIVPGLGDYGDRLYGTN